MVHHHRQAAGVAVLVPSFDFATGLVRVSRGGRENRHLFDTVPRLSPKIRAA
jgi:hypothetical protein